MARYVSGVSHWRDLDSRVIRQGVERAEYPWSCWSPSFLIDAPIVLHADSSGPAERAYFVIGCAHRALFSAL